MAKGAAVRYPAYTTAKANVDAIASGLSDTSCAMADDVLVEPDTNAGLLQPVAGQRFGPDGPLGGTRPGRLLPERRQRLPRPARTRHGQPRHGQLPRFAQQAECGRRLLGGHRRRLRPRRRQRLARVPPVRTRPRAHARDGQLRREHPVPPRPPRPGTQLPPRTPDRPLVSVVAAGAIWSYDEERNFNYGQSLKLEWGVQQARRHASRRWARCSPSTRCRGQKAWRNLRFPLAWAPPEANVARIVADDPNLSSDISGSRSRRPACPYWRPPSSSSAARHRC